MVNLEGGFHLKNNLTNFPIMLDGARKYWKDCNNKEKVVAAAQVLESLFITYALDSLQISFFQGEKIFKEIVQLLPLPYQKRVSFSKKL